MVPHPSIVNSTDARIDFPTKYVDTFFVLKNTGIAQTPCLDAFLPDSDDSHQIQSAIPDLINVVFFKHDVQKI